MRQQKEDKGQDKETLFERLLREKRMKKLLLKNDTLFIGIYIMIGILASKGMFTI